MENLLMAITKKCLNLIVATMLVVISVSIPALYAMGEGDEKETQYEHAQEEMSTASETIAEANERLFDAARHDNVEMAIKALDDGANIDARDWRNATPLHYAATSHTYTKTGSIIRKPDYDNPRIIELLITRGAHVDATDRRGSTPLSHATLHCCRLKIQALLAGQANPNIASDYEGQTPLYIAIRDLSNSRNLEIVKMLLNGRSDVNVVDSARETPLVAAIRNGSPEKITMLLDAGASIHIADVQQLKPLHHALKIGNPTIITMLVKRHMYTYTNILTDWIKNLVDPQEIAHNLILLSPGCLESIFANDCEMPIYTKIKQTIYARLQQDPALLGSTLLTSQQTAEYATTAAETHTPATAHILMQQLSFSDAASVLAIPAATAAGMYGMYKAYKFYKVCQRVLVHLDAVQDAWQLPDNDLIDTLDVVMPQLLTPILKEKKLISIIKEYVFDRSLCTEKQAARARMWQEMLQQKTENERLAYATDVQENARAQHA